VLLPVLERYRDRDIPKYFRSDSAFALPKLLRLLEKEGFRYAIRRKANPVLERKIAHLLKRPVGRPSHKPKRFYASFRYRAGSWDQPRRVVAKVEWHGGELFSRVCFIVTDLERHSKKVVRFYNRRGTAEQWIKERKNAVKWTKLSCRRFKYNAARLQLFALAYNLANFFRQLVLPKAIWGWTLTTLREKLIKFGEGGRPRQVHHLPAGGSHRPEKAVRPNPGADRPPAPGLCLGVRLGGPTTGSESRRRGSRCARRVAFGG
jgi:hypothetical protein